MKKVLIAGVVVLGMLSLRVVAGDSPTTQPATQPTTQKALANKFCPFQPEHPIDPKVTVEYKDKKIGFCCKDCIEEFKADPEKYMKGLK